jgi:hypothetical protein
MANVWLSGGGNEPVSPMTGWLTAKANEAMLCQPASCGSAIQQLGWLEERRSSKLAVTSMAGGGGGWLLANGEAGYR